MPRLDEVLKTVERLLPYLDRERLEAVLALVREYGPKIAAAEAGGMPASAVDEMVKAVPDELVRDIVNDLRKVPEPGWIKDGVGDARGAPRENTPLKVERGSPYGTEAQFEAMVNSLVGSANDTSKLR